MKTLTKVVAVLLLLFSLDAAPSTAEIKSVKIQSDDGGEFFLDYFQFTSTGHVSITVSDISVTSLPVTSNVSRPDPSLFGFFLLSDEAKYRFYHEYGRWCSLHSKFITLLFTLKDLPQNSSFSKSYPVTYPDGYSLYFVNCNPLSHLTMDVRTELYNIDNGDTKDYLSAGKTKLPRLYFTFSLIYLCFLVFWMFVCFMNYKSCYMVHILMGVLLVTKAINLYCETNVQHSVKVTGTRSYGWDVLLYIFEFITPALFYTVMVMIYDGCLFLGPKAKMSLMIIVIPLQVLATVLSHKVTVGGIGNGGLGLSAFGLYMVQTMLFITIVMPIASKFWCSCDTEQGCRNYSAKVALCRYFVVVAGVYLAIHLLFEAGINSFISHQYNWKSYAAQEIISLVFYILMFIMFMPFWKHVFDQHNEATEVKEVEI